MQCQSLLWLSDYWVERLYDLEEGVLWLTLEGLEGFVLQMSSMRG